MFCVFIGLMAPAMETDSLVYAKRRNEKGGWAIANLLLVLV